ncbi:hypothetical protein MLD38_031575 [Melastoma candidum]|uniref:Uncharacterized protein n=1 Tax=Melastoma candidum TaxID=119954 RepID=A0ACB9MPX8_9MYRT|nr:hypothetical protein MLD38_031575 [Melastoma candidum]
MIRKKIVLHTIPIARIIARPSTSTKPTYLFITEYEVVGNDSGSCSFTRRFHWTGCPNRRFFPKFRRFASSSAGIRPCPFQFLPTGTRNHDPRVTDVVRLLKEASGLPSEEDGMSHLEGSGTVLDKDLILSVIWELREEWRVAYLGFKWGERCGCDDDKVRDLMVWVLGSCGKFGIGWCLIRDFHSLGLDVREAMLVMIDRYAAANLPSKALETFDIMEKFRLAPDEDAHRALLFSLCKYGYLEEAEEFMMLSKKLFPLSVDGFNIILNGWCNGTVDRIEARRIWKEMARCCVLPDATSYTCMISCFSKLGDLSETLRLYDEMRKRGHVPGLEVYNSLIYVLTDQNCFSEALKMLDKVKEMRLRPDLSTYNSMISPLCKSKKLDEAMSMLSSMAMEKIEPDISTYHAFLGCTGFEGTLGLFSRMKKAGLGPDGDSFLLVIKKFLVLKQAQNALKIWIEMRQYDVQPGVEHYTALVDGLMGCGYIIKAKEIYSEMISRGFPDDPKLKKSLYKSRGRTHHRDERKTGEVEVDDRLAEGKARRNFDLGCRRSELSGENLVSCK